jgi:DNA-binding NtrC family response regulator
MKLTINKDTSSDSNCAKILVVDDHSAARESMIDALSTVGHTVEGLPSAIAALERLSKESYDIIISDLQMPGMTGLEFVRRLSRQPCGAQIIMVTAHASVSTAVDAMRLGAFDYIEKPFGIEQLESIVSAALERGRALDQVPAINSSKSDSDPTLIGSSRAMTMLRAKINQVARTNETVLITGESGTGKEMVARSIHALSERAAAPLIGLNCPVLSAQLMESELFGHEKGSFTGADTARTGRFELANQGTILLDEISEIDLSLQAKLLRVLQERTFERVGSSKSITADVRVLATSNRNLKDEIKNGRFREDLYYRLAVVPLQIPALRDRTDDIVELSNYFLKRAAIRLQRTPCSLTESALKLLQSHDWPGNVRELDNLMTRASVLSLDDEIDAELLQDWIQHDSNTDSAHNNSNTSQLASTLSISAHSDSPLSMQEMERKLIESTLDRFEGHRAKTAEALGIGVRTLSGKLKLYGYSPRSKPQTRIAS